ncbi:Dolichyl pyrophosphate Glc1Man9GlcNAc2 alpha-1,3-glucosyltransferase [Zychaea mexicana]|uniref:Dolichyl pyrophosphate Glc1Man9GlcNAc2 alpha-1,3-glucosyltransferase n=1 Tax=Zychaea mexicana TaxID=64656 RepID=UPI0022FE0717|nr:Dolichyl pyrophosphate Glc1Man9GlcNAc2 alpha-1,3-glucosyltransferase [Zychaea mexicana]KAI9491216.1 Dolichyl pyrophosphate Glc1Man9GlcNAc2 alpha-1,3-glucosyltransferase [Zychaea mexicana]
MSDLLIASTILKILLIPAYRSTDFEVHRNWLAITHSLPISKWYIEKTSIWTLDYPPFFAWFEKFWSAFAQLVDPAMLVVDNLEYASWKTVVFQRMTVIISELVLYWSLKRYIRYFGNQYVNWLIAASIFLHPGLLIYNGFLYGILLLSIVEAKRGQLLLSGILFAVLLNFKHIYLYMAPAYFVYLLKAYCFTSTELSSFSIQRFINLGGSVIAVFALSLGPFIHQLPALVGRLFPFTRGLCHAYWAPNFWALYAAADRCLIFAGKRLGWSMNKAAMGSMTRGYVGDTQFAVLPDVQASHTMILTLIAQLAVLQLLWRKPTFDNFLSALTLCGFASFLFGWHVHEKAILIVLIPYSLMAANSKRHLRAFAMLSAAGIYSLYPLLFHAAETPIKVTFTIVWALIVIPGLAFAMKTPVKSVLQPVELLYLSGLVALQLYSSVVHELLFVGDLQFLPLLLTSVYCGAGVMYGYLLAMNNCFT